MNPNARKICPQPGPQTSFLSCTADIGIYGGSAGGGKSYALLLEPLRHVTTNPMFNAQFFRRTTRHITNSGGLWDESSAIYPLVGGVPKIGLLEWSWPKGGRVRFDHLEHEQNKINHQGAQYPLLCCEETEQVRMADGSLRRVEEIQVGDMVATLQGPRQVLFAGNRRLEPCVKAEVRDDLGRLVGSQIHSETHRVLTPSGWKSYLDVANLRLEEQPNEFLDHDKSFGSYEHTRPVQEPLFAYRTQDQQQGAELPRSGEDHSALLVHEDSCVCSQPCLSAPTESGSVQGLQILTAPKYPDQQQFLPSHTSDRAPTLGLAQPSPDLSGSSTPADGRDALEHPWGSKESRCARIFSAPCDKRCQSLGPHLDNPACHSALRLEPSQSRLDRQSASENAACREQPGQDKDSGSSLCEHPVGRRPFSALLPVVLDARFLEQEAPSFFHESSDGAVSYVPTDLRPEGYLGRCSSLPHLCDEHVASDEGRTPADARRQDGAAEQIQKDLLSDDLDKAQKYSRRILRYAHPYRGLERTAKEPVVLGSCEMEPCGKRWVIDLTIAGESHYISKTGLVNQNCFDELTHFTESQFWYLLSRNRSMSGVKGYVRATCNPDADSWVARLIEWWIDQSTGFPIPERAGVLRWVLRVNDTLFWAGDREELIKQFTGTIPDHALQPKSVTFIPAKLTDNKALMQADPSYMANLLALPTVERERLLSGNWRIRPSAGLYFQKKWLKPIAAVPDGTTWARGWDLAATPKTETNNPDFTESVLIGRTPDGRFIVADHTWMQGTPEAVRSTVLRVAKQDAAAGYNPTISIAQDPGQSGKTQAVDYTRLLVGFNIRTSVESRSNTTTANAPSAKAAKIGRFGPFSAQCEGGNVYYVQGSWNGAWFDRLEAFPEASKDDTADATSRAFGVFLQQVKGEAMLTLARRHLAGLKKDDPEPAKQVWQPGSVEYARAMAEAESPPQNTQ